MDLSIVILTSNEVDNIRNILPKLENVAKSLRIEYEIIVVDNNSSDGTAMVAENLGAKVLQQEKKGFGNALKEGFGKARGSYILTLDADFSHPPLLIFDVWRERKYDIVIASRWIKGGKSDQTRFRKYLSLFMNFFFRKLCSIKVRDLNSNFRLYKKEIISSLNLEGENFEILPEILIKAYAYGYEIKEIPFHYRQREKGKSKLKLISFGISYAKNLIRLWRMRNSVESVDYDERAYNSRIPIQKFWQRKRLEIVRTMTPKEGAVLDVGCGSSMIIQQFIKDRDITGLDISEGKLRYLSKKGRNFKLVKADIRRLPFSDGVFDIVIASNVIEHVDNTDRILEETKRVLKRNGFFIIAFPDYGSSFWKIIEAIYDLIKFGGSYKEEHITKLTRKDIEEMMDEHDFIPIKFKYILKSELIYCARVLK